jgi:hypothetical protein
MLKILGTSPTGAGFDLTITLSYVIPQRSTKRVKHREQVSYLVNDDDNSNYLLADMECVNIRRSHIALQRLDFCTA